MRSLKIWKIWSFVTASSVLSPTAALAAGPTADQCISANEDGAVLRKRGKLLASKTSLGACSSESCPKMVRDDCLKALAELDKVTPTIRFQAMEGQTEIFNVRVLMDNEPLFEKLEGKTIAVDPGDHLFTFFASGHPTQTRRVTLKEGDKDHVERIDFGTAAISPTAAHLVIMTEPGAGIVVDGKGPTLGRFEGVMTPGGHEVRVAKDGKVPALLNVDLKGAGETQVNVTLQNDKPNYFPYIVGGAIVVAGLLIGGGIAIAVSK